MKFTAGDTVEHCYWYLIAYTNDTVGWSDKMHPRPVPLQRMPDLLESRRLRSPEYSEHLFCGTEVKTGSWKCTGRPGACVQKPKIRLDC